MGRSVVGKPSWAPGSLVWREGGALYRVLGKIRGEQKAIVAKCNRKGERDIDCSALVISIRDAEQLGYVELKEEK